ncbi:MAG: type IV toxin-antitoxin system AbiEi family antitoxin domain-containing protein [Ktedonobacterales bacterium]
MASSRAMRAALMAVAPEQSGYFTARQALGAGYAYPRHHYHVRMGDWERVARGVFHLRDYPLPERENLIVLSLLSHDRTGQPQAVFSHETALALHDFSDANPARIHLTVPPGFRRQLPEGVVIHRTMVPSGDWEERDGYRVTTPLCTLRDIAASPASWPYLEAAVRDALRRGLVRRRQLLAANLPADAHARLAVALAVAVVGGYQPS